MCGGVGRPPASIQELAASSSSGSNAGTTEVIGPRCTRHGEADAKRLNQET